MKGTVRVHVNWVGSGTKVSLFIYQFMASGMTNAEYTNGEGDAYIEVDTDQGADAEVYVAGQLRVKRSPIQNLYYI